MNIINDEANLKEDKKLMELSQQLLMIDLNYLFKQYDNLQQEINNNNIRKLIKFQPELSPTDLLKAQSALTKLEKIKHELTWMIYSAYIKLMYLQGNLAEYPLRNMLSEELDYLQ